MTNPMLAELDEVVRLMDAATQGPWEVGNGGTHEPETRVYCDDAFGSAVATCHHEYTMAIPHAQEVANAALIAAAVNFLRTHHATLADMAKRLEAAERDAAMWRLCNGEHAVGDEVAKCHVNVGVNIWRGDEWLAFDECSPDELSMTIKHAKAAIAPFTTGA